MFPYRNKTSNPGIPEWQRYRNAATSIPPTPSLHLVPTNSKRHALAMGSLSDDAPYFWATVTLEDIWNNRLTRSPGGPDLPIWMSSSNIEGHTIYIPEHLSQWTYPKPPTKTTNWFVLYRDIKRNWNKMNGLRNRRRIWGLQEKMVEQMKEHIGEQALSAHSS